MHSIENAQITIKKKGEWCFHFFIFHITPQKKIYECLELQKFVSKKIRFLKNLKIHEKILLNPHTFLILFYIVCKKRCSQKKPQFQVETEDGCEAP